MYKLIAMDLDDTLLNDDGCISEENKTAIKRAEAAGLKIVVASGRSYASSKHYVKELGLSGLTVSLNGACVHDAANGTMVAGFPIEKEIIKDLLRDIEPFDVHINLSSGEKVFCQGPSEYARLYSQMNRIEMNYVESLAELSETVSVGKLLMSDKHEKLDSIRDILQIKYGTRLNIAFSKPYLLEVTDLQASKGAAVLRVAEMCGIKPHEIMAIGDGENDLTMIKSAGMGVAMGNAKEKVRKEADFVTLTNNENGVAYAINQYIF